MCDSQIKKYRPSNGTEGDAFISQWCGNCARDLGLNGTKDFSDCSEDEMCNINLRSTAYRVDDPNYPTEWTYDGQGPCCTAFIPIGEPIPQEQCKHTVDMFGAA